MTESQYSYEEIHAVINQAANEIIDLAQLPDSGTVDALNLLVSATLLRLGNQRLSMKKVAATYGLTDYRTDKKLSDKKALDRIVEWINGW